jgi:magnesium transporter
MTVIASFIYRGGERAEELPLSDKPFQQVDGEFAWIGVAEPTVEEMTNLKAMFGLHPLAVEDALNSKQVPKVEVYGDQLFVIIKTAHLEGDKIAYGETCIVVGRHYIVSVRQGSAKSHKELREQLEHSPKLLGHGPDYVLHGDHRLRCRRLPSNGRDVGRQGA